MVLCSLSFYTNSELHARMVLALYLIVAMGGTFFVEQPASSVMIEHDRMIVFRALVDVFS